MRVKRYFIVLLAILMLCACSSQSVSDVLISEQSLRSRTDLSQGISPPSTPFRSESSSTTSLSVDNQSLASGLSKAPHSPVTSESTDPQKLSAYNFHDIAVKESVERYFDKPASRLTADDYATLS